MSNDFQPSNPDVESVFQAVKSEPSLTLQTGWETDVGGNPRKPNQDRRSFVAFAGGSLVAVWDGHGAQSEDAVEIADNLLQQLVEEQMDKLLNAPAQFLEDAFESIHIKIIERFKHLKCGSTFSVILFLKNKIWIANVGDSTGILYSKHPIFKPTDLKFERDAAIPDKEPFVPCDEDIKPSTYLELTSEHSPEDPEEYKRMRNFKSCDHNPLEAELLCVYDNQDEEHKKYCHPTFNTEKKEPTLIKPDSSFKYYYKNVRKDVATYVCHRTDNRIALASTRSIGDHGLNILGVSNKPIIKSVDLENIFKKLKVEIDAARVKNDKEETKKLLDARETLLASGGSAIIEGTPFPPPLVEPELDPMTICIVLCTDGVWDNWIYDHVGKFVMDKSCLKAVMNNSDGAQRVAKSFMFRNKTFAKKNFGISADNATGTIMYLTQE
jgi:serine/threonine protein phosphatase PrpC